MQKSLVCGLLLALASTAGHAATPLGGYAYGKADAPAGTEWENPQVLALNKEQPHAYFFNFASVDKALKVLPEHSLYYVNLNGTWKFNWVNHPDKRPIGFSDPSYDVSAWDDIQVPGCWNVQGIQKDGSLKYGKPIYTNQLVPFYVIRDSVGDWKNGVMRTPADTTYTTYKDRNEVGSYRRSFYIPDNWKGREVYLNFDGVDSFFYLWINGQYVGFSKNSRNLAQFNITPYLVKKGPNTIAVEVYRYSDAGMLEAQDMFRLPGIFRSVYLTSTPTTQIQDMVVRSTIDPSANPLGPVTASVAVENTVRNLVDKKWKFSGSIRYSVYPVKLYSDETENKVLEQTVPVVSTGQTSVDVNTVLTLNNARLWSAEQPNRYVLVAELLDKKGKTIEIVSTYFGVRHVEIRNTAAADDEFGLAGRYFYVNNRPVKLKGVNRHENNLATGHTVSHDQMEREVMLMKQGNINHVRNSHYNDDPYWYILCDKYGIYLEDEANLESHQYRYGAASLSHPVEWRDAHVARNMEMVHAHVNHPSIVIWSLGNEAGPGKNFVEAYNAIKAFDTSRPVQYERNNDIVDMGSNQYPPIPWVYEAAKGKSNIKYPFHISEYAHSMGNALGGFADYWDAMESSNFFCGGAIWDWIDQALWNYTPDGTRYMAYGGDFGDKPNDGMFCMNGIIFPDLTPKPQYAEVKRVHQYVGVKPVDMTTGTVEVFNKNYFTTLGDLTPRWILTCNGVTVASGETVKRPRMEVGPRESQTWSIPYDYSKIAADPEGEYFVTLQFLLAEDKPWAKKGYVQAEVQLPVNEPVKPEPISAEGRIVLGQNPETTIVTGSDFNVAFNNETGTIDRLEYNGQEIITPGNGPVLNAFRAPVDNDVWNYGSWFANGLHNLKHHATLNQAYIRPDGAAVVDFTVVSQAPARASARGGGESGTYAIREGQPMDSDDFHFTTNQIWTIYRDGTIELSSAIDASNHSLLLPRLGYKMQLPAGLKNYTYYGRGPVNNFNDRQTAQKVGLYESTVADQFVPFPKPQSMGNREGIRWNALTDGQGNGVQFIATNGTMSASALPYDDIDMMRAAHPYQLPESKGTTLHLDNKVTGLGGASCGQGIALPPYRTLSNLQSFGFMIRPVSAGVDLQSQANVGSAAQHPLLITRSKDGVVTIASANPDATILYNVVPTGMKVARGPKRKIKETAYEAPFDFSQGGTVNAWDATNPDRVYTATFSRIEEIPVEVIAVSSEMPSEKASNLVDGNPETIWHTVYGVTQANYPHWIIFDAGAVKPIKGFTYWPRTSGDNGDIKDYTIEVSTDNQNWTKVAEGAFDASKKGKRVDFTPTSARYLRFTGLSSQNGQDFG
ncbi:MAG: discoidin domain-containing protein, partial [Muribaculaceae bacterium]|nr:discoidin domain-containing protein [Muribaculaceae bacterium]